MSKTQKAAPKEEQRKPLDYTRGQEGEEKMVKVRPTEIEIPDAPPKGYGADKGHVATEEEAAYLQECWNKEPEARKRQLVAELSGS